jgi:cyanate permease
MSQHEEVTLGLVLQVLVVTANLTAAFIAFFLYEASPWNFAIAGLAVFAAIAIAISMWLNKQETERFRNATNAAEHSMLGGR